MSLNHLPDMNTHILIITCLDDVCKLRQPKLRASAAKQKTTNNMFKNHPETVDSLTNINPY